MRVGQAPRDAGPAQVLDRVVDLFGLEVRGVEVDTGKAVHLDIEEPWKGAPHPLALARTSPRVPGCSRDADAASR